MVDLILLEALKQFYPKLYKSVALHQHLLTGVDVNSSEPSTRGAYHLAFGSSGGALGSARVLLLSLFPKLEKIYGGELFHSLRGATEDSLYANKSVASAYYFKRYFSYAVQDGEIPEAEFDAFLAAMHQDNIVEGRRLASSMIARANDLEFIRRLDKTTSQVTTKQAATYCLLLELLENDFTSAVTSDRNMHSYSTLSRLIIYYAKLLPEQEISERLSLFIIRLKFQIAQTLFQDITEFGHWSSEHGLAEILTSADYDHMCRVFVSRSLYEAGDTPWYEAYYAPFFLRTWTRAEGKDSVVESLRKIFSTNPSAITDFLSAIAPLSLVNIDYGNLNIQEHTYEALKENLNIHYLYEVAHSLIKNEESMPYKGSRKHYMPSPTERLHQLVYWYNRDVENASAAEE